MGKSIKSLREYQLGVVFTDKYGRETPVISNPLSALSIEKENADKLNRLKVKFGSTNLPEHLTHFKFYIKETSGEYYNMAMDRWYEAEDGNIWLAFPSSDRNKIDIDSFLILKKGSDQDDLVKETARYKVIAIENEAPDFIKTSKLLTSEVEHIVATSDLFGSGVLDNPVQGVDNFSMKYLPYKNSPGQSLHKYTNGKLYLEFGKTSSSQMSDRYRITDMSTDFDTGGGGTTDPIDATTALWSVKLDRDLQDDINFITDSPSGLSPTKIEDGTTVKIYKYEVENKPQFDGRFFVKIYSDEVFKGNISKSFKSDLDFRILSSKKVYYMSPDHRDLHTHKVDYFLTDNRKQYSNRFNWLASMGHNTSGVANYAYGTGWGYPAGDNYDLRDFGYYAIPAFTANALFFRRYNKGVDNERQVVT